VGRASGEYLPPDFDIDEFELPEDVPVSLPADLVGRRTDILSAQALLHADSAGIGVATAQMLPSFTISASLAEDAVSLARLVTSAMTTWGAGVNLDAPLFHGGALSSQRRGAIDAYRAQLATYTQTILAAFGQVADSLSALRHDEEMVALFAQAVDVASASLALQRSSYAAGKRNALQLIVAENTYSNARIGAAREGPAPRRYGPALRSARGRMVERDQLDPKGAVEDAR